MNIVIEKHPKCLATLRVEIPADQVAGERRRIVGAFTRQARLPGFRPGKVPRQVIEKRFEQPIADELESRLVREGFDEALRKEQLKVLDFRRAESPTFHPDGAFSFSATLVLAPDFELPPYHGIEIEVPRIEVTEAMVDDHLSDLCGRFAEFRDIEGRPAAAGDIAVVNFHTTLDDRPLDEALGEPAGPLAGREEYWVPVDKESFPPGLGAAVVGHSPGEEFPVPVTLPDDWPLAGLRGREVVIHARLTGLKEQVLPELSDELANKLIPGADVAELRKRVAGQIVEHLARQVADIKVNKIIEHLNRQVDFELPEELLTAEIQGQADALVERGLESGMSEDEISSHQNEIFNAAGHRARTTLCSNFLLQEIARAEKIEVGERELLAHLERQARSHHEPLKKLVRELREAGRLPGIRNSLLIGKTIDFLVDHAIVREVEPPPPAAEPPPETPPETPPPADSPADSPAHPDDHE